MSRRGPRKFREWDSLLPVEKVRTIRERRLYPDGNKHQVTTRMHGGKELNVYPWSEMKDGDFFEVKIKASREAMNVHFRQSAAINNIEVVVADITIDNEPALMVTRILGGVNELKKKLGLPTFDVKKKYERVRGWRKGSKPTLAFKIPTPDRAKVPESEEPPKVSPVVGSGATDFHDDYVERLAEMRRKAIREAAGLDDEDEDVMGVTS